MKISSALGFLVIALFCMTSEATVCQYEDINGLHTCSITDASNVIVTPESTTPVLRVVANQTITSTHISPILAKFPTLKKLEIPNGNITTITSSVEFITCASLTDLQISKSSLSTLNPSILSACVGLQNIDFSHNSLTVVPGAAFTSIASLKSLNLAYNTISTDSTQSTIFSGTNAQMNFLTFLNLSSNSISAFNANFKLPSIILTKVDLSHNKFSTISNSILSPCRQLEELYLNNNEMTSIASDQFNGLNNLKVLNIGFNKITSIDNKAFQLFANLESLNISSSSILPLDATLFSTLTKLKILDMHDTKIINGTSVDSLKTILAKLPDLKSLNISANRLGSIDGILNTNTRLTELYINDIGLEYISDDTFNNLTFIVSLSMKSNKITQLKAVTFSKLVNLEYLDVSGNQIKGIQSNFFDALKKLKVIKMNGNSCLNEDIIDFNNSTLIKFKNCFDNYNKAGTLIVSNLLLAFVIFLKFA